MNRVFWILVFTGVLILFDFYAFQAVKTATQGLTQSTRKLLCYTYWGISILTILSIFLFIIVGFEGVSSQVRNFFVTWVVVMFLAKTFVILFLLADDISRFAKWLAQLLYTPPANTIAPSNKIPRSEFLAKAGL